MQYAESVNRKGLIKMNYREKRINEVITEIRDGEYDNLLKDTVKIEILEELESDKNNYDYKYGVYMGILTILEI